MNAPRAPRPIATSRFGYPFKDKDDREIVDPYAFIEALIPVQGGHYLLGSYGFFHGGIHLDRACSSKLSIDDGIRCLADGEVVAYRIDSDYHDATPGDVGDGATLRPYSTGFVLVRHRVQAPSPPMPATPPPMETPGADIRDWGTRLYADPQGRQPLAWLRHGTSLIVQVGAYTPGQSTLVRVTDTLDSKLPREGWISRTHLALDPAVGTGMRSAFGLKDTVATTVYRGDSIDPDKSAAHAENKAQRQRPEPETAPVLTLYSLYMHVASERDYERNAKWKRPSWWPERGGTRKPEATDRVVALAKPLPIRQGDLIGYLGEDVPAHAYPIAGQPVTKRLLHLEVFSGDDVPAYLVNSRRWAKEYLPDSERTLLLLMPGDTLQRDLGGPAAATVSQRQILRASGFSCDRREEVAVETARFSRCANAGALLCCGCSQRQGAASGTEVPDRGRRLDHHRRRGNRRRPGLDRRMPGRRLSPARPRQQHRDLRPMRPDQGRAGHRPALQQRRIGGIRRLPAGVRAPDGLDEAKAAERGCCGRFYAAEQGRIDERTGDKDMRNRFHGEPDGYALGLPEDAPQELVDFANRRKVCDYFREETPFPDQRERQLEVAAGIKTFCSGTDRELSNLRGKYGADPAISERLAEYDAVIESGAEP